MNLWQRFRQWLQGEQNVYYIGGSDVLPPPLKGEAERQAIEGLGRGEEAARQTLVEHNLRLVVYIARRFENTGTSLEDLISIGTIGLMKAIGTYRMEKNIKLATYASRCIENEILMHIRKISNQKAEVSLDEPINQDGDGNELLLSDILGTGEDEIFAPLEGGRVESRDGVPAREDECDDALFSGAAVSHFIGCAQNSFPGFRQEFSSVIQRAGDAGDRTSCLCRDVADCYLFHRR